jgi:class 3 adenylate cyclase
MTRPETRYARVDEGSYVAYQIVGDGPIDLVYTAGWFGHVEAQWDYPAAARFLERLSSFSRLIIFDRRGHGLSDPIDVDNITLEQWMEDVGVVMDAAGSERAALIGAGEGGPMTMLFAATHPMRTSALVLVNTQACIVQKDDYQDGMPRETVKRLSELIQRSYWDAESAASILGPITSDVQDVDQLRRLFRYATSPGMVRRLVRTSFEQDVRNVLSAVRVPTLVLHRSENMFRRVTHGRYLAEHISGAKYVELPGVDEHPWTGDQEGLIDEIEEFVTGVRRTREPDRVLTTVLFTDMVGSTERAAQLGDRKWREILDRIDVIARRELDQGRGRFVKDMGDGFFATFDGPARAVRCAVSVVDAAKEMDVTLRVGLHTGEVELAGDDVRGIAVHIGARVAALAAAGEVLVSRTVTDLVAGSGLAFSDRGSHSLKGVPGEFQLFAVER